MLYKNIEFKNNGVPVDQSIINSLNFFWGGKLPSDYFNFLSVVNGGIPDSSHSIFQTESFAGSHLRTLFGITPDRYMNIFKHYNIPKNMIAIGDDDYGNLILLAVTMQDRGKVYFWDHELACEDDEEPGYENLTLIADSFDKFLSMLYK